MSWGSRGRPGPSETPGLPHRHPRAGPYRAGPQPPLPVSLLAPPPRPAPPRSLGVAPLPASHPPGAPQPIAGLLPRPSVPPPRARGRARVVWGGSRGGSPPAPGHVWVHTGSPIPGGTHWRGCREPPPLRGLRAGPGWFGGVRRGVPTTPGPCLGELGGTAEPQLGPGWFGGSPRLRGGLAGLTPPPSPP